MTRKGWQVGRNNKDVFEYSNNGAKIDIAINIDSKGNESELPPKERKKISWQNVLHGIFSEIAAKILWLIVVLLFLAIIALFYIPLLNDAVKIMLNIS